MDNNLSEKINNMPDDWWKTSSFCASMSKIFKGYTLGFWLSGDIAGTHQKIVYSGFLLKLSDYLFWITAGHVVDSIKLILSNYPHNKFIARWIDWENKPNAESIPINLDRLELLSFSKYHIDIGLYILSSYESELISKNQNSIFFSSEHWENLDDFQAEGYYLLGFPYELVSETTKFSSPKKITYGKGQLICLPVKRIQFSNDLPFKILNPDAFYGEIIDFPDNPNYQPNVPGMSGGPLLAIKRDPQNGMIFKLYGIQSSWIETSRKIKAESLKMLDEINKSISK